MARDPIDDLVAENARLKATSVDKVGAKATLYVVSIVILSAIAAGFVLAVTLVRPEKDNGTLITTVIGIITPIIAALLAATVQEVHLAVNSRLSQLLELTSKAARAEGKLSGGDETRKENKEKTPVEHEHDRRRTDGA